MSFPHEERWLRAIELTDNNLDRWIELLKPFQESLNCDCHDGGGMATGASRLFALSLHESSKPMMDLTLRELIAMADAARQEWADIHRALHPEFYKHHPELAQS